MIGLLLKRRILSSFNHTVSMKLWEFFTRVFFIIVGAAILVGIYYWFYRVLRYLDGVQTIGPLLPWKLTSMAFLITFSMVAISGLIAAMTTLYYSYDLKFLFSSPIPVRTLFLDKTIETAVYSSWTLGLVLVPYIIALGQVKGATMLFYVYFLLLMIPFVLLGAAFGIALSLALMYFFPTSRTRDAVWIMGSLSLTFVYMMIRFVQPERLSRPDSLEVVANYLNFLQAPTAPYMPSWWITRAMMGFLYGQYDKFLQYGALLCGSVVAAYGLMTYFSKWVYQRGFSGAQEGFRYGVKRALPWTFERWLLLKGWVSGPEWTLLWKDRKLALRDVRYWSQMALIAAIVAVYLFSISHLPVEGHAMKSMISFANLMVAGFVLASLGLRFTFPAISMEGRSLWVMKSLPMPLRRLMVEKFMLLSVPLVLIGVLLVGWSNMLLDADMFITILSTATIIMLALVFCCMGIGLGALFPKFNVENIHQIESSAGGFIYMTCCLGYLGLVLALEAYPVRMHFLGIITHAHWDWRWVAFCAAALAAVTAAAAMVPWKLGLRALERYEA